MSMTNQPPREFWILDTKEITSGNSTITLNEVTFIGVNKEPDIKTEFDFIHVIEEGPVLEKIKRLELALQKCKEQRDWYAKETTINKNELARIADEDAAELESILEGK